MSIQTALPSKFFRKKRIAVSQKRQITIPIDFHKALGITDEVECVMTGTEIVIRPLSDVSGEFDEQILADLINQGYSGKDLLKRFKEMRRRIEPAIERMIDDAKLAAEGKTEYFKYEDLFDSEN
jgi:bifunctional DNA-binding transcriptional regulator/antitoxin component of YhaV-PrlF toxin-antitoxin module